MPTYLIVADLDSIQEYVFGTTRLPTIRGASALVETFGENVRAATEDSLNSCICLRYQGGQVVLVYEGAEPESIERWLRREARRISGEALTATTAHHFYDDLGHFNEVLTATFAEVRHQKEQNSGHGIFAMPPLSGGYVRHCDLCHQLPAVIGSEGRMVWQPGGDVTESRHLCTACWRRLDYSRQGDLDRRVATRLREREFLSVDEQVAFPQELTAIWPDRQEGRYLAMLAADGDGIGRLLADIPEQALYQRFSERFREIIIQSLADATVAAGVLEDKYRQGGTIILPLMPIVAGGDDFSVLLRPEKALAFASDLAQSFATQTANDATVQEVLHHCAPGTSHLTLSVGIAITKPHFPFSALRRLSQQLRASAKRQRLEGSRGTVDFALISSAGADNLERLRQRYQGQEAGQPYYLTERPYTQERLEALLRLAAAFAEMPRSQRKYLYGAMWEGPAAAAVAYGRTLRRNGRKIKAILEGAFRVESGGPAPEPFTEQDGVWQTPVLDALELIDL